MQQISRLDADLLRTILGSFLGQITCPTVLPGLGLQNLQASNSFKWCTEQNPDQVPPELPSLWGLDAEAATCRYCSLRSIAEWVSAFMLKAHVIDAEPEPVCPKVTDLVFESKWTSFQYICLFHESAGDFSTQGRRDLSGANLKPSDNRDSWRMTTWPRA